jgi:phosphoglycolate phosphatase
VTPQLELRTPMPQQGQLTLPNARRFAAHSLLPRGPAVSISTFIWLTYSVIELVIFDCDGVLFDSAQANIAYYNTVLERLSLPPMTSEWERRVHFLASGQVYEEMFGAKSALAAEAHQAARELGYTPFFELMRPVSGLQEVLAILRASYRLAMATNRGSTVPEILRRFGLDQHIELAVGIHDVERPKPHPDMLVRCLRHFGVSPQAAVYIGDAETDEQAATAASMHFVAVGECPWARRRVPSLLDLPGELARLAEDICGNGGPRRLPT